jgi:hypothetical protein
MLAFVLSLNADQKATAAAAAGDVAFLDNSSAPWQGSSAGHQRLDNIGCLLFCNFQEDVKLLC